jgi:SAM-dependent methyltransferase
VPRALSVFLIAALFAAATAPAQTLDAPYVPTPHNVVDAMLELAKVGPRDFVVDLGSGDGRIVIAAAKRYGARGFGVDLDAGLVHTARREARRQGVADRVEFHARNLFITDISQATVLTTYLYPRINLQLRPRIFAELAPGTRVVSHEFDFGTWPPDAKITVPVPDKPYGPPRSDVLLWIVPANAAGRWQWELPSPDGPIVYEARFRQTFQMLKGEVRAGGRQVRVETARLSGASIALVLLEDRAVGTVRHELTGTIEGDSLRGTARTAGASINWRAQRVARGEIDIEAAAAGPAPAAHP